VKPKLIVVAGPNGSGKTSLTETIQKHDWIEGCRHINPDNIAQEQFGDWNSPKASLDAAVLAQKWREEALAKKESIFFETVFSSKEKIDFLLRARAEGYFIRLFFVATDSPTINASRVAQRVLEGGHDVPITKIISRYSKSIAQCSVVAKMVDRLYVYDNSVDFEDPRLLFRLVEGKLEKKYQKINPWAQAILASCNNKDFKNKE
jgi:predicted ABC-type ATPase